MPKRSLYKIIHTSSGTAWGNTEQRILKESTWMKDQGHQVIIIAPLKSPLFLKARARGIAVYPISFKPLARIGEHGRIKQIFITEKPFVVNSHGYKDAMLALKAARKTDVPCRIMSHHQENKIKNSWGYKALYKRYSHYVFTDCEDTNRLLQQHFKLKDIRIFSIPCGIIQPVTLPNKENARKQLALQLGIPPDARFIGIDGCFFSDTKNDLFIEAFDNMKNKTAHHIVVTAQASKKLSTQTKLTIEKQTKGRIHFINSTTDTWHLYRALDCSVIIPRQNYNQSAQGIPLPVLEAMYAECPVIAPERSGITNIIEQEKNGLLYKDGKTAQLLAAITQTVSKKTDTMARTRVAHSHVKRYHTIDTMGRDILRIYRLHQVRLEKRLMT